MGKFCMNCGKELDDNIRFCSGCGAEVSGSADVTNNSTAPNNQGANNYQNSYNSQNAFNNSNNYNAQMPYNNAFNPNTPESLLRTLSERYKINGIIWIVLGILQGLIGLYLSSCGIVCFDCRYLEYHMCCAEFELQQKGFDATARYCQ